MPIRKNLLANGEIYHIFNKSIAGYKIFNTDKDYERFIEELIFYKQGKRDLKFSKFGKYSNNLEDMACKKDIVSIIAYAIMPTHFHLILRQEGDNGISDYVNYIQKSYTLSFNNKHKRRGPLWQGRFKNVLVQSDEQLIHLTRYVHLNAVTAQIVDKPENWRYSSYLEYLGLDHKEICNFKDCIRVPLEEYKDFVDNGIDYQRELAKIKHLLME